MTRPNRTRAFTLLELAVVLTIISLVSGGAMMAFTAHLQASQFNATVARMDFLEKTLQAFSIAYGRVPCPSNLTCIAGQLNYGAEGNCASTTASCTSGTTGVNNSDGAGDVEGGVPTRALRLPDAYMYDAWGRRLRYAVATSATTTGSVPVANDACTTGVTVNDATGAARTTQAIYAIISHGANGHGAYTSNGVMLNAGSDNASELTNCHCTSSGVAGTYTSTYVEQLPSIDPNDAKDSFDDLVTFRENWQLATANNPLVTTVCVIITTFTPPANGNYSTGQTLTFTAVYSAAVNVTGTPRLDLSALSGGSIGTSNAAYATYHSGTGTTTLTFTYTIISTDTAPVGIQVTSPVDLNGGTITAASGGGNAVNTFTPPNMSGVIINSAPRWWPLWFW